MIIYYRNSLRSVKTWSLIAYDHEQRKQKYHRHHQYGYPDRFVRATICRCIVAGTVAALRSEQRSDWYPYLRSIYCSGCRNVPKHLHHRPCPQSHPHHAAVQLPRSAFLRCDDDPLLYRRSRLCISTAVGCRYRLQLL